MVLVIAEITWTIEILTIESKSFELTNYTYYYYIPTFYINFFTKIIRERAPSVRRHEYRYGSAMSSGTHYF